MTISINYYFECIHCGGRWVHSEPKTLFSSVPLIEDCRFCDGEETGEIVAQEEVDNGE